jgi:hypothetical protein
MTASADIKRGVQSGAWCWRDSAPLAAALPSPEQQQYSCIRARHHGAAVRHTTRSTLVYATNLHACQLGLVSWGGCCCLIPAAIHAEVVSEGAVWGPHWGDEHWHGVGARWGCVRQPHGVCPASTHTQQCARRSSKGSTRVKAADICRTACCVCADRPALAYMSDRLSVLHGMLMC